MAAQQQGSTGLDDQAYIFHQLDAYPWDTDEEFQGGLRAILGDNVTDPEQRSRITIRAKCFYYTRKAGALVDYQSYKAWVDSRGSSDPASTNGMASRPGLNYDIDSGYTPTASSLPAPAEARPGSGGDGDGDSGMGNAPKPATFAEICDMIAEGKPIPGIKDIPDTILEGQASSRTAVGSRCGGGRRRIELDAHSQIASNTVHLTDTPDPSSKTFVANMAAQGTAPVDAITGALPGELRNAIFQYHVPQATAILLPEPYYPDGKPATVRNMRSNDHAKDRREYFTCNLHLAKKIFRDEHTSVFQKHVYDLDIAGLRATVTNFDFDPLIDRFMDMLTRTGRSRRHNFPIMITLAINQEFVDFFRRDLRATSLYQWLEYADYHRRHYQWFDISYTDFLPPTGLRRHEEDFLAGFISSMVQNNFKGRQIPDLQRIADLYGEWYRNRPETAPEDVVDGEDVEMVDVKEEDTDAEGGEDEGAEADEDGDVEEEDGLSWDDRQHFDDGESDENMSGESEDEDDDEVEEQREVDEFYWIRFGEEEDYDEQDDPAYREDSDHELAEGDDEEEQDPSDWYHEGRHWQYHVAGGRLVRF
ncbi:hypothetical protein Tdes44962_MAKER07178 [Teratosphaeria destructans]|uniref:Uncharacterized protein n=1 Tax=Teratosphaeria destructans TaxID=418781 RepID=A0A9W7T0D9_9PEZI|nr:hypothetical protein Tdes44962_MAKER07178 [Teratosphaeria destructans]